MIKDKTLRELKSHKKDSLPLRVYREDHGSYHWHNEYEFLLVTGGTAHCTINGQNLLLEDGDMLLIHGGELHSVYTDDGEKRLTALVTHPHFFGDTQYNELFSGNIRFQRYYRHTNPTEQKIIETIWLVTRIYYECPFALEFRIKALLAGAFEKMLDAGLYSTVSEHTKRSARITTDMLTYIAEHYGESLSLATLADAFHYSKTYILKLFHQDVGMTPTEYIVRYRLDRARELLYSTSESILNIALTCGFRNVSYFIRAYKKQFSRTPHTDRKMSKNNCFAAFDK